MAFITCLVYANALENPFHYDDFHSIGTMSGSDRSLRCRSFSLMRRHFLAGRKCYTPLATGDVCRKLCHQPIPDVELSLALSGFAPACVGLVAAIGLRLLGQTLGRGGRPSYLLFIPSMLSHLTISAVVRKYCRDCFFSWLFGSICRLVRKGACRGAARWVPLS